MRKWQVKFVLLVITIVCAANILAQDKPLPRVAHSMAYDESRKVFVTFGGMSPQLLADTWEFDGKHWKKLEVSGPTGRTWHVMEYDPNHKEVLLFGGKDLQQNQFGDTWAWDGRAWKNLNLSGPTPRSHFAMATDRDRKRLVLFGGAGTGEVFNDTWEFDGKAWKQVANDGPPKRAVHAIAYDKKHKVTVLFGGMIENKTKAGDPRDYFGDTWTWDGKAWKQMSPATSPQPRFFHLMIYDEALESVVLLAGGQDRDSFNDAWQWTGSDWKKLEVPSAPNPSAEAFVYDPQERAWLIFGGSSKFREMSNKVYRLQNGKWIEAQ